MYKVGVVLYKGCYLSSLTGPVDAFQIANSHIQAQLGQDGELFEWKTVSLEPGPVETSGGFSLQADTHIGNGEHFDFIYIPGFLFEGLTQFNKMMETLSTLKEWLVNCWKNKSTIGANCTGTFILAETGLLDGRKATTTWWLEKTFRQRYPHIHLNSQAMLTEQDNLICAGTMTAYFNLALHIIEKQVSEELAMQCAKTMLINTSENAQSPYHNLLSTTSSSDPVVAKTQYWINNHLDVNVDQVRLAEKMGVSQRTLIRRFKGELGVTPLTYLQNVRIETAKTLLEHSTTPLAQVVHKVGYNDISSFTKLFKQRVGLSPIGYRRRFTQAE
jgi:transcriptional regulator GlxA family with amidase domain